MVICTLSIYLSAPLSQNLSKNNKVETENWKKFKLGELFEIETGTDLIYQDQIEGKYPVVGHNESNNGITCLIQKVEGRRLYDHNITIFWVIGAFLSHSFSQGTFILGQE